MNPSRRLDAVALLSVVAAALLLGGWYILISHPAYFDIDWIAFERGNQLYRARQLLDGRVLYRDISFQYGPLAAYLHAAWSAVTGVSIAATLAWHLCWSTVGIALGFRVFRRFVPPVEAALYSLLLWIPLLLEPGGLIRIINAEHQTLDRVYLLLILLLWKPPTTRSAWRAAGIGLAMGAWQCTKFGGAIFAGAAMVLADVGWLWTRDRTRAAWQRWLGNLFVTAAVVVACEGLLAAWSLTWATPGEALEILWPARMAREYDAVLTPHWPSWHGTLYFVQYQFLLLFSLLLGVATWTRSARDRPVDHSVAWIAAGFYVLGIGTYIRVEANFYLYAFALAPLVVTSLLALPESSRRVVAMMLLIPNAIVIRSALTPWSALPGQAPPDREFRLPDGEALYLTPPNVERMHRLEEVARQVHARPGNQVVLAWLGYEWEGGGYLHFYEPHYPLENFFATTLSVRSSDVEWMRTSLPRIGALVLYAPGGTAAAAHDRLHRFLPADLAAELTERFEKVDELSDRWLVVLMPRS